MSSLFLHLRRRLKPNLHTPAVPQPQPRLAGYYYCFRQPQQPLNYSTISHDDLQASSSDIPPASDLFPDPPPPNSALPAFAPSGAALSAYAASSVSLTALPTLDIPPPTDPLLSYIATQLMRDGKRHTATRRVSKILLHLYALTRSSPLPLLRQAVELASPSIRVKSHKAGGKVTQKPVPLSEKQRTFYAVRWILKATGDREKKMIEVNKRKVKVLPKGTVEERFARVVVALLNADPNQPKSNPVLAKKVAVHELGMINRCVFIRV